ncbi:fumarylacetoacetate hydrolase family protein [Nocardioides mangrovi]|uniref:Fumarylacetoacetate hydrolase family protein n=1 Tax=Nocardioides mangrovi TaxID=2874580 RepID=A0ABS7UEY3_9ACTN|nr:fumarylacetoacetate hydrolase family protein [Nocardioides mangrovi]MBZ5739563.1 fumarylacetoacetate hydrolase family protein [Nocardioides mangrovi]
MLLASALTGGGEVDSELDGPAISEVELLAPTDGLVSLRDCIGFLQHVRNTRRSRGVIEPLPPMWSERPAFYFANPASVRAANADIAIPTGSTAFDFELEIGAVIGRGGSDLDAAQAADHIAGYVLYCDWSARDAQAEERVLQIGQGKGKDAAISLGPWALDAAEAAQYRVEDGFAFEVSVSVNGEVVHAGPFRGMDWSFEELVAYASVGSEIRAGDVIASGTLPLCCLLEHSASADFRGWLQPGDVVRLDGGPLGAITTTIQAPAVARAWRRTPAPAS